SDETVMDDESNQERMIAEMDQDDDVVLEDDKEDDKVVDDVVKDVHVEDSAQDQGRQAESQAKIYKIDLDHANKTKAQARKNMMLYLKNVVGFKMDYFKGVSYDDIRPIFESKFNSNVAFLLKKEQIEEDKNRALQRLNETPAKRAAKRQKLDEEVEELKRHL
nr:hypothetical protein [Tanacetum cinerariifolium]